MAAVTIWMYLVQSRYPLGDSNPAIHGGEDPGWTRWRNGLGQALDDSEPDFEDSVASLIRSFGGVHEWAHLLSEERLVRIPMDNLEVVATMTEEQRAARIAHHGEWP